ncbi:catechol 2,3-dioxygenase [Novosphingobium sp. CCH12-A3]|uniref:catechol 2,3-dioxygenase n=1 Tax=Novosphingobium sp. CCH12-A3 TaxID=1768752 RepID=UPI000782C295|nr:catechol 2,3-dioxygenase [Novosphingobium sp. CCH12-A3]
MSVLRLGHVQLRVMNIDEAIEHYVNVIGMTVIARGSDGKAYLKCWDEWDAYSLILEPSDSAGLTHIAFKVAADADLDALADRIASSGADVEHLPAGSLHACGRTVAFRLPSGHQMILFAEKDGLGTDVGNLNPDPWPDSIHGIGAHWLDHLALVCEFDPARGLNTVADNAAFLRDVLDFKVTEQCLGGPDGSVMIAAFLTRTNTPHDIACVPGPSSGLHHIAFFLDDWNGILRAADIVAKSKKQPSLTPNRHGMTRGATFYMFDPSGNRNETFAGLGYLATADRPLVTWTEDQLDRGLFFLGGEDRTFVEVYS